MESAMFGLLGVFLGSVLTIFKDWLFERRKRKKEAEYLVVKVACELDRYAYQCAQVVEEDGTVMAECNNDAPTVEEPVFEPESFKVEWKSLPVNLMYEVLDFPFQAEAASKCVDFMFREVASPPDYAEGFEERQLQFAMLGINASKLAEKLRAHVNLPCRKAAKWDIVHFFEGVKSNIEFRRDTEANLQS